MNTSIIARWASRGGAHFLMLSKDEYGYSHEERNGGGYLGNVTEAEAMAYCEQYVKERAEIDGVKLLPKVTE